MALAQAHTVDLTGIEKGDISKLDVLAVYICKEKGQMIQSVLAIGKHLAEVKEILGTGGKGSLFGPWVVANCAFTVRTADRYIDSHVVFGGAKLDTVSNLDQTAMYLLASDSTPEDAAEEARKRAGKGEQITPQVAKEIIAKHSPSRPTPHEEVAVNPEDQAKKTKQLAHSYRDNLARAICDYHELKPHRKERDRLVKLIQGVELW